MSAPIDRAYELFVSERFPIPTDRQVAAFEREIRVQLPIAFRHYLLEYNGGFFREPDIATESSECPEDCLNVLYGIGATHESAEITSHSNLKLFSGNSPMQLLPIGYTLMGNLLALVTAPNAKDCGHILLKKAHSDRVFCLAPGIEGFFTLLREPREDEE